MSEQNNHDSLTKERVKKEDLRKNPDKYVIKKFNSETHELVFVTFNNGTNGWVERKKKNLNKKNK